jgi:hypothetical protein
VLRYVVIVLVGLAAVFAVYWMLRRHTPEERLAALQQEVEPKGGVVLRATLQGRPATFLLLDCEVFMLEPSADNVQRTKVLKPGFYPWFTACTGSSIHAEDDYVVAVLENRALGAGGGNTSGGTYRSRDGMKWEKRTAKGWLAVEEAQD